MKQLIKFLTRANEAEIMELTALMQSAAINEAQIVALKSPSLQIQNLLKRYEKLETKTVHAFSKHLFAARPTAMP